MLLVGFSSFGFSLTGSSFTSFGFSSATIEALSKIERTSPLSFHSVASFFFSH